MNKFCSFSLSAFASLSLAFTACSDNDTIGSAIVADEIEIITNDSFTVTGQSVDNNKVQSRTIVQLLGSFNAGEYGNFYSDFVTQFMPSAQIETENVTVDGLTLRMAIPKSNGCVGDTIIPMGLEVYELTQDLKYPIFSDFGNEVASYYDPNSKPIGSAVYNFNNAGQSDSLKALAYIEIPVELPVELANRLYNIYLENPDNYLIPELFAKKFHGLYVKSTFGNGRVVKIGATLMTMDYHVDTVNDEGRDTTYYYTGNYYSVSPEIITNNNINYQMSQALQDRRDAGETLLVAPIGLDVEIDFPINDILNDYQQGAGKLSVVNSLTFTLPVEEIENNYGITPPPYILMVRADKKDEFFAKNQITDNINSFLGTYSTTNKCYTFPDMRSYLNDVISKGSATQEQSHFVLTPVTVNTETNASSSYYYYGSTTETVNSIVPYVETPVMVKILLEDAKIRLSYSKQTLKM